jgi:uncharacterized membrane protein
MSQVIVVTFEDPESAGQARETIRGLEKQGLVALDDAAVVVKDAEGKIHVHGQTDHGVKVGAVTGGIVGGLLFLAFPVAGIAAGAASGALIGASTDLGIDKNFLKDVENSLKPNNSALFLYVKSADFNAELSALRQYNGKVYQTSLDDDQAEQLRFALHDETRKSSGIASSPE